MKAELRILFFVFFLLLTASCGGGGSGDSTDSSPSKYSGVTSKAKISEENSDEISLGSFESAQLVSALIGDGNLTIEDLIYATLPVEIINPDLVVKAGKSRVANSRKALPKRQISKASTTIDDKYIGNKSGSITYHTNFDDDSGEFQGNYTYSQYSDYNYEDYLNGEIIASATRNLDSYSIKEIILKYSSFEIRSSTSSITIDGTISYKENESSNIISASIYIVDNIKGNSYWIKDYIFETNGSTGGSLLSGIFYHPDHGYVNIETFSQIKSFSSNHLPSSGELLFNGLDSKAHLKFFNGEKAVTLNDEIWIPEPIARAGSNQTVTASTSKTVFLDGSSSSDSNNSPLIFKWSITSKPSGSNAEFSDSTAKKPTFIADVPGDYIITLVVNNGTSDSQPSTLKITAQSPPLSSKPVAKAGSSQTVLATGHNVISLDGSTSSDPSNRPLTYKWSITSSLSGSSASLSDASAVKPTFIADLEGDYTIKLIVNNGYYDSSPATVTVSVVRDISILDFRPIDAEYSKTLEKIIMVAGTPANNLHIYDPVTKIDVAIDLPLTPRCVSVSPDGKYAAVGYDSFVSYIDISSASLVKTIAVSAVVYDIVLAGNGYIYAFPELSSNANIHCIKIDSGETSLSTGRSIRSSSRAKLHPDGKTVYCTFPSDLYRFDISSGQAIYVNTKDDSNHEIGLNLWISSDGYRIFSSSGNVFRSSSVTLEDMTYNGTIEGGHYLKHMDNSSAKRTIAAIPLTTGLSSSSKPLDIEVQIFDYDYLTLSSRIPLPKFIVNSKGYLGYGSFVFYSSNGSKMFVILKADATSALINDFGVVTY